MDPSSHLEGLIDTVDKLIAKGRPVFPLSGDKIPYANCKDCRGKTDAAHRAVCECLKNGGLCHGFYAATLEPGQFKTWMVEHPDCTLIAVPTGKPTGIFVFEYDPKNGGLESFNRIVEEHGPFETEANRSPSGGVHYIFEMPDFDFGNIHGKLWPGIDIKATGGYHLVPPSHDDHGSYEVINDIEPQPAPQWLLDLIREYQEKKNRWRAEDRTPHPEHSEYNVDTLTNDEVRLVNKSVARWQDRIRTAEDGTQNILIYTGARVLFSLAYHNLMDEEDARAYLEEACAQGNHPQTRSYSAIDSGWRAAQVDPDPIDDLIKNTGNFYRGKFTRRYPLNLPGNYSRFLAKHESDFGYLTDQGVFAACSPRNTFWELGAPTKKGKDKTPVQHLVTDTLFNLKPTEQHLWPNSPMSGIEGDDEKTWEEVFDSHCQKANANAAANENIISILNYNTPSIDGTYVPTMSSHEFDNNGDVLPFRNGVLDLATLNFREVTKDDKITIYLPWDYELVEECPETMKMLERAQPDPMMRDYLQRRAGYALSQSTSEKKFWIDQGVSDGGKSTMDLIQDAILGPFAFSGDPALFSEGGSHEKDAEKKAGLFRKRMITLDEWKTTDKLDAALIKSVAAGSPDNARFLYGDPFDFTHTGKVFITTNNSVKMDLDTGIITRLVVVPWNTPITPEQKIAQLELTGGQDFWRWVVKRERMGILNYFVKGYQMWRERPLSVDVPDAIKEATRAYIDSDPIQAYFLDHWVRTGDSKDRVKASDFYQAFLAHYTGDDKEDITSNKVTQSLKSLQVEWQKSINFGINPDTGKPVVTSGFRGIKPKEK